MLHNLTDDELLKEFDTCMHTRLVESDAHLYDVMRQVLIRFQANANTVEMWDKLHANTVASEVRRLQNVHKLV